MASYSNTASLCLVSYADALYQIWISLILCAAMLLNTAMCVYISRAPLSAGEPANAHAPQLASQLSVLETLASIPATVQGCTY